jgi:DNA polymerase III sliding clamp (beta) subunit (PCNA family)
MSVQVNSTDLKLVVKLSRAINETPTKGMVYTWANVHRLVARGGRFVFYANDGRIFFEWNLLSGIDPAEDFEVVVPAEPFRDLVSRSLETVPCELKLLDQGTLELNQDKRRLKIRTEPVRDYPNPGCFTGPDCLVWSINASFLKKNLQFVESFIDGESAKSRMRVATWDLDGNLRGGSLQGVACVKGLPVPKTPLNLTRRSIQSLVDFLEVLKDEVQITVAGNYYLFKCSVHYHCLILTRETEMFPELNHFQEPESEVFSVERAPLLAAVLVLSVLLLPDEDRLLFQFASSGTQSMLRVFTSLNNSQSSHDMISAVRESGPSNSGSVQFALGAPLVTTILKKMKGKTLTVKYYDKSKVVCFEDKQSNGGNVFWSATLVTQGMPKK